MRDVHFLAMAWIAAVVLPAGASAQDLPGSLAENEEISVDAEQISYDQKSNTVVARGSVVINRGDTELHADEVHLDRATNEANAIGNVRLTNAEGTIEADEIHLNLDEETGVLKHAEIQSQRYQYSLWGDRVEKGLGQQYRIENGRFTTCQCGAGAPSWSISGEDLQVTVGGYGVLRGGTFNILDQPVAYLPRALFPVQRDRQSGFLIPRFGVSSRRGFQTLLPFYWAISKSQDATLALDVETSARAGLIGEYRYTLSRDTRSTIDASYFTEQFRGESQGPSFEKTIPENRWSVRVDHTEGIGDTAQAFADVRLVGDDLFLREINTYAFDHSREVRIRTLPFTESRAGLLQLWDRVGVKGEGIYYQDLTGFDAQTVQRAPEVTLWGQHLLGDYLLGDLNAGAVDFQRGHSVDGLRLDVQPGVTAPLPLGRWAFGAVRVSARETAYHLTDTMVAGSTPPVTLPENQSREMVQVGADVGTTLDRIYDVRWFGLEKIKHTLEPGLSYLYIPSVGQGELPLFDGTDRVNRRTLLSYGLVSRFIGKFSADRADDEDTDASEATQTGGTIRELARFSAMQSFDISREINPLQPGRAADHFSDIDFDGRINPSRALSVRFRTNYDTSTTNISAAKVGFFIEDPRLPPSDAGAPRLETRTSAGVSYRFLTQNILQEIDDNIVLRLTDWAGFLYSSRFDVVANRFLDNHFGLRFVSTCDCWALDIAVTDRTNPQEVEVRAQLTLVGIGSSKKSQRRVATMP